MRKKSFVYETAEAHQLRHSTNRTEAEFHQGRFWDNTHVTALAVIKPRRCDNSATTWGSLSAESFFHRDCYYFLSLRRLLFSSSTEGTRSGEVIL